MNGATSGKEIEPIGAGVKAIVLKCPTDVCHWETDAGETVADAWDGTTDARYDTTADGDCMTDDYDGRTDGCIARPPMAMIRPTIV